MSGNDFTRTLSPLTIRRNWTSGFNDRILAADLDSHDGTRDSSLGNVGRRARPEQKHRERGPERLHPTPPLMTALHRGTNSGDRAGI